ncbi:MAG: hypothetical protein AAGI23_05625 [Bacteroidota bacterium]
MENSQPTLISIREAISKNRVREALKALEQWCDENGFDKEENKASLLLSRWNAVKDHELYQSATAEDIQVGKGRVKRDTLELLLVVEEKLKTPNQQSSTAQTNTEPFDTDPFQWFRDLQDNWKQNVNQNAATNQPQPPALTQIFHDDFVDNRHHWNLGDITVNNTFFGASKVGQTYLNNGQCIIDSQLNGTASVYTSVNINPLQSYAIETTVQFWSGNHFGFGINWGANMATFSAYYFLINSIGQLCIGYQMNGQSINLANWIYSPFIHQGAARNKLRLESRGNQFYFFINDQQVFTTMHTNTFYGGQLGMTAVNHKVVGYDYFSVWN